MLPFHESLVWRQREPGIQRSGPVLSVRRATGHIDAPLRFDDLVEPRLGPIDAGGRKLQLLRNWTPLSLSLRRQPTEWQSAANKKKKKARKRPACRFFRRGACPRTQIVIPRTSRAVRRDESKIRRSFLRGTCRLWLSNPREQNCRVHDLPQECYTLRASIEGDFFPR